MARAKALQIICDEMDIRFKSAQNHRESIATSRTVRMPCACAGKLRAISSIIPRRWIDTGGADEIVEGGLFRLWHEIGYDNVKILSK